MKEDKLHRLTVAVHSALSQWHNTEIEPLPWSEMVIISQQMAIQSTSDLQLIVKGVLLNALDALEEKASEKAKILRLRFLDLLTTTATANCLNLSIDMVHKRQRAAIEDMASLVWDMELGARHQRAEQILQRLEIPIPSKLFGVDDKLMELVRALTTDNRGYTTAIVGIGGIGKTSLADAVVRHLAEESAFVDIAWISARQERFTFWHGLDDNREGPPALTTEKLMEILIEQLGTQGMTNCSQAQKQSMLRAQLKSKPHLVVLDNLETAVDYRALIPEMQRLSGPTHFLFTSRDRLLAYPSIYSLDLDELSAVDSLAMLRHEAKERGLAAISSAPNEALLHLYDVAGGNPLALKLLLGQLQSLSLSQVVNNLYEARGKPVEELYRFIYRRSWQLLTDEARKTLAVMPLLAETGGGLDQLGRLSDLPTDLLTAALQQLIALSLVNVKGPLDRRRYSIHRLTATFLVNEVLKWQTVT